MALLKFSILSVASTLLLLLQIGSGLDLREIRPRISHLIHERSFAKRQLPALNLTSTETFLWGGVGKKCPGFLP